MRFIPRKAAAIALFALAPLASPAFATPVTPAVSRDGTPIAHAAFAGVIKGRVTEKESGQPIFAAQVSVIVGTNRLGASSDATGEYTIRGAPTGTVTVSVTRIGFVPISKTVIVPADGDVTADFVLVHAALRLEEVVTTATGEQSRREIGNVVATVKADSITKTQPVTNVAELLQARAAGVQVLQTQGVLGSSPNIRIRGISSLSLSNEPLIVVDGTRYSNEAEPGNISGVRINRLSTLDPEEIESIDVIKGPSAAALYGTAAANGVVVITTKKGRAGSTHWSAFAESGATQMPGDYPANYWSFGRNLVNGVPVPVAAGAIPPHCTLSASAQKQCIIDSATTYNPWTDPRSDPFRNGPTGQVGVQATGGSDQLRFFVSGDHSGDVGPYHMPNYEIDRISALRFGAQPAGAEIRPNQLHQTSLRGNFTFALAPSATLNLSTGYQDRDLWTPFDGTFFAGLSNQLFSAPGYLTSTNGTAREYVGDIFGVTQRTTLERFNGSASFNWTPLQGIQLTAEGGVDNSNANNTEQQLPGQGTVNGSAWGPTASQGYSGIDIYRTNSLQYTATVRGQGTRHLTNSLTSITTLGGQFFKSGIYTLFGEGYGLGVGSTTPTAAQQRLATTTTTENATAGGFVQQQLNYKDKLYATASARVDENSAFGKKQKNTVYPSANVSYVMSDESWFPKTLLTDRLRLRGSVGQAGLPPGTTAAITYLSTLTYPTASGETPGLVLQQLGNTQLKPEVTTEYEAGADLGMFNDRVNVELTYFAKIAKNELFQQPLPPSAGTGAGSQWVNLAQVDNKGVELALDAALVDSRMFAWSARLSGSHLKNKLVDIGSVALAQPQGSRNVVGYPLFGLWDRPYTYKDANGDGIIVPSEIKLDSVDAYKGSTLPEYEAALSNTFGLFNNRVHVNVLMDYRGKYWNSYTIGSNRCVSAANCEAINVPGSSLDDQAAAVAAATGALRNTRWGIFQPNDFIKLRETSVAFDAPASLVGRYLRGHSAQLVLSGRNLATLWTKYPGIDPEANRQVNGNDDLGTPPAIRYWIARINLAF
ncbi:MAG: SusC/RagA family TonB-linked outer membrane protein [Gemmatimonadaceae bacterium]